MSWGAGCAWRRSLLCIALGAALQRAEAQSGSSAAVSPAAALHDSECARQQARPPPSNTSDLFEAWLQGYDRYKRPNLALRSHAEQISGENVTADVVRAGLYINQLWSFNEIDGTFMIQAYLTLGWRDPRLCFDDAQLPAPARGSGGRGKSVELDLNNRVLISSGVDRLHELWLPDVNLQNSLRLAGNVDPDADLFKVYSNGEIEWSRRFVVTLSADLDFAKLPFDTQFLYVNLESYRMPAQDLSLKWDLKSFPHGLDAEFNNPEWEFLTQAEPSDREKLAQYCGWDEEDKATVLGVEPWSSSSTPRAGQQPVKSHCDRRCWKLCEENTRKYDGDTDEFSRVRFSMVLKRQTHSWVFGAILPSVILCMISYLGLYIARDNPGRPGVHCVTILAHFTLDSSMRTQIPHVGKNMWIDHFQTIMLFSHLALFLEYTIVHYSARQKYREQVITDAQLRKLMAFDEVAAEILSNPQLAAACGLVAKDTNGGGVPSRLDLQTERTPPRSPGSLSGRLTSAAAGGGGGGDVDGWSAGPPAAAALPTSLSPQDLEEALASMPAEAKRQILHKLRTARARLGGSVSEWGETPEEFYPSRGGRKWAKVGGAPSSGAAMAAAAGEGRGMFGFGGRETIATAGPIQQAGDDDDADAEMRASGETEDDDEMGGGGGGPAGLNVTPGRELPGTPDKAMRGRRLRRLRDRSTTDHAIVGSLSEPLFGDSGTDPSAGGSALGSGPPPHLPGQSSSSPVEELELGDHPDDDTKVRKREWCGGRMKAKARHFCSHFVDWYNETMTMILANASNLDRPCRMLFPVVFSLLLGWIFTQAGTDVTELIDQHLDIV